LNIIWRVRKYAAGACSAITLLGGRRYTMAPGLMRVDWYTGSGPCGSLMSERFISRRRARLAKLHRMVQSGRFSLRSTHSTSLTSSGWKGRFGSGSSFTVVAKASYRASSAACTASMCSPLKCVMNGHAKNSFSIALLSQTPARSRYKVSHQQVCRTITS
jgi:hypothetical protein